MRAQALLAAWRDVERAKPLGWEIQGLRCGSRVVGGPSEGCDRWIAEACGPADGCLKLEAKSPAEALYALGTRLRELRT